MYNDDFKIRDFVRVNAEEWELFENFKLMLKEMNKKICYEALSRILMLDTYLSISHLLL